MARDIVVIGASAGGVEALRQLVGDFPAGWQAAVFVVIHLPAGGESMLPVILERSGPLPARHPADGMKIVPGTVFVAPPNHHMILDDGHVRLTRGPRQNRHRPSVDTLFRSAACSYGPRVIGTVLTGALSDGSVGLRSIRARGGVAIVQDPRDAKFPSMPQSALSSAPVDHCVPLAELAPLLVRLAAEPAPAHVPETTKELKMEVRHDRGDLSVDLDRMGTASYFTCPECHGTLWEIRDGDLMRYRCRVGHGYSAEGLIEHMDDNLEDSLWEAARSMMENAHLKERVAARLIENDKQELGWKLQKQAAEIRVQAGAIRDLVSGDDHPKP